MAEYTKAAAAHFAALMSNFSRNMWCAANLLLICYKQTLICYSVTTHLASDEYCHPIKKDSWQQEVTVSPKMLCVQTLHVR